MTDELVTIARGLLPHEAHMLRLRLEQSGIRVFLQDENTAGVLDPFHRHLAGGVRVQIPAEELQQAQAVPGLTFSSGDKTSQKISCPDCGAKDVEVTPRFGWRAPMFLLLHALGRPLPPYTVRCVCRQCGRLWSEDAGGA